MEARKLFAVTALALATLFGVPLTAIAQLQPPPPAPADEGPSAPPVTPDVRTRGEVGPFVYSATLGASAVLGHIVQTECYWDEEDVDHDGTDLACYSHNESTGTTVTADFRGGLGLVVSRSSLVQSLGYQLHLAVAGDGLVHRHELAWRFTVPGVFSGAAFGGASLSSPWEGRGATGFNFGADAQVWISGPFVAGAHFTMDGFEAQHAILLGFGAFVGFAG